MINNWTCTNIANNGVKSLIFLLLKTLASVLSEQKKECKMKGLKHSRIPNHGFSNQVESTNLKSHCFPHPSAVYLLDIGIII